MGLELMFNLRSDLVRSERKMHLKFGDFTTESTKNSQEAVNI